MTELSPPSAVHRELQFEHGRATGTSNRWQKGQYCSILTPAGIVGCGIYDLKVAAEFDFAIAIARGTPACPLVEPEDLLEARIVAVTPRAGAFGIQAGMSGREAVELMLQAGARTHAPPTPHRGPGLGVKAIDHVTVVVKDLDRSRKFYAEVLGMRQVPRPAFSFEGAWFQAGKTQVHLILEFARSAPAGNLLPAERRSSLAQHTAFEVDDANLAAQRLREMQIAIVDGPKLRPDGYVQVFVTDPDGHVIELCSPKVR
jgi:catechol 2,3-dioxygenase-like lactoylglutathione lyase family enzyme/uncharacterized protein YunC (DUF1805 family)